MFSVCTSATSKIRVIRKEACVNLEKQATPPKNKFPAVNVGVNVIICISVIDKNKIDLPNVIEVAQKKQSIICTKSELKTEF